jgi:AcrR family transcriptional regulator
MTVMARWQPDARGRLQQAAMELYQERGFDHTTVADIAEHAGLTERTFFRYFADKREVLFAGSNHLQERLVAALDAAPESSLPLGSVISTLAAAAGFFPDRDHSRRRQAIISAHPDLQERELIKLASLAAALGAGLRRRGVPEPTASLTAETGVAVFKIAFMGWINATDGRGFADFIYESVAELKAVASGA